MDILIGAIQILVILGWVALAIFLWKKSEFDDGKMDPMNHCGVYKKIGCSHVDGIECNMCSCSILKEFNAN